MHTRDRIDLGAPSSGRSHDLLVATLIGLSWFVLAHLSIPVARAMVAAGWWPGSQRGHVSMATMLVLGLALYVPVAIRATGGGGSMPFGRLRSLGLFPSTRSGALGAVVLMVVGVVITGPATVWSAVREHLNRDPLGVVAGLQPAILEEFLVRGIVWAVLLRRFPPWTALVWASVVFWTWHWRADALASSPESTRGRTNQRAARNEPDSAPVAAASGREARA